MTYFNTTKLIGPELLKEIENANGQSETVIHIFKAIKTGSPSVVHRYFVELKKNVPLTSIRRCMTNLTNNGKLKKTKKTTPGLYGKPEFIWKLK